MLNLVTDRGVLNLFRKVGESIEIEGGITIRILDLRKNCVRLQIIAPKEVGVLRTELCEKVLPFSREGLLNRECASTPNFLAYPAVQDSDPVPAA